jgi:hypothetical protein
MAKTLAIDRIGAFDAQAGAIHRLRQKPAKAVKFDYLLVSENVEDASWADVITIKDFRRLKEKLKKKARPGLGLEMVVAQARKMDSAAAGRWLADISDLYNFCQSAKCQFILSSGEGMISGQCLDAILETCGIDSQKHWVSMSATSLSCTLAWRRTRFRR